MIRSKGFVYSVDTNLDDMLALLLDVCYTVPGLVCVPWKVTRITGVELWCSGIEHAQLSCCDVVSVAVIGSLKIFFLISLVV